jgi:hypothetical protein
MRWMREALVFVSLVGVLFLPAEALAITLAPPGKSGADQYFETIPNSAGNAAPPSGGGTNGSSSALSHLGSGRAGSAKLSRLGKDGRSAAALAAATAPSAASIPRHGHQGASASQGDSPITSLGNALSGADSGGLGIVLPLLLGTTLVLGLGLVISRARHPSEPPELRA